jgi:hypothetical protein
VTPDHSQKLDLECLRAASGCVRFAGELGPALESEILRLVGGPRRTPEEGRKLELECLRTAADCMQLAGEVQNFNLQRHFLELARQLTSVAEATPPAVCQTAL